MLEKIARNVLDIEHISYNMLTVVIVSELEAALRLPASCARALSGWLGARLPFWRGGVIGL